ncbi:MAG: site-2 protease family protein [Erysipelotrichales bacterium]|nr:site-2 protease family protein [Erysipelotrichales bacterium]
MMTIISILAFLLIFGLIIMVHEIGHFLFIKRAGILCHEFSLGMGPIIYKKRKGETLYTVRVVPFGGFAAVASGIDKTLKVGQEVGLVLSDGLVTEILIEPLESVQVCGIIEDFDLHGENSRQLSITLRLGNITKTYLVNSKASYIFHKKETYQIAPFNRSFEAKSKRARFLAIVMGPVMNFALAFVLFMIYTLFIGVPNLDSTRIARVSEQNGNHLLVFSGDEVRAVHNGTNWLEIDSWLSLNEIVASLNFQQTITIRLQRDGSIRTIALNNTIFINSIGLRSAYTNTREAELGDVVGRAESVGIEKGMIVRAIRFLENDQLKTVAIDNFATLAKYFSDFDVMQVTLIMDDGQEFTVETFGDEVLNNQSIRKIDSNLGLSPVYRFCFASTVTAGFRGIFDSTRQMLRTLRLVFGSNEQVSVGDLSGPVGIYVMTRVHVNQGFWQTVRFTAFLSLNVGFLNLLPIPAFDGGRLLFLGIEATTGKKVKGKLEDRIHSIVFYLLMAFMVFITFRDILRFF